MPSMCSKPVRDFIQEAESEQSTDNAGSFNSRRLLLELLYPKLEELQLVCETWSRRKSDGGQQVSGERLQSLTMVCLSSAAVLPWLTELNSAQSRDVEPAVYKLVDGALAAVLDSSESQALFPVLLRTARPFVPTITTANLKNLASENVHLLSVLARLARAWHEQASRQSSGPNPDMMDIDDDFDSQVSTASVSSRVQDIPRDTTGMGLDSAAFYLDTSIRLTLLEAIPFDPEQAGLLPERFLGSLFALSDEEFLLCRAIVLDVLRSDLAIGVANGLRMVEKIGGIIGRVPEYDCCETALATCIDVIQALQSVWINSSNEVADMVGDLYHHLVKKELPNNALSPRVLISLVDLLLSIMSVNQKYADDLKLSSCRTTLLSIDQNGPMVVKFHVGTNIAKLFGFYVLKEHENIFVDILKHLPTDPDCIEGIAYRLHALAELAQRWPTLLRRCVFHIFETPGNLPESASYATRCLARVATSLRLKSPKELFGLFAPQILYTWIPNQAVDTIPYSIFGFQTLRHLLAAAQTEIAAQMVMREQEDALQDLAQRLSMSADRLVVSNFPRIMAYAVAYDLARQRQKKRTEHQSSGASGASTSQAASAASSVTWLKKLLGTDRFMDACYNNFADIAAILMNLFDQEENMEKYLDQMPESVGILAEIKRYSSSDVGLPPNQQPVFKASHLLVQLSNLCKVTPRYDVAAMWTPALVVFVARKLINTVHPALGSLHACSVLRKIRVLICLAGAAATTSYPLEMLLHSIRTFVVDSECADDAMGISQYLITKGKPYLEQVPSFLAGYGLSTLASLRVFLESSQSSTTQESQFKATMSKAKRFHSWLTNYLADYTSPAFSDAQLEQSFRSITQSAAHIRSSGNADKGTHESSLLLEILRDQDQPNPLLNESARDLALGLLCGDFKLPSSAHTDIIESDEDAVRHGAVVWRSCKAHALSDQYLAWAGRVAGRSFAASGRIPDELLQESRLHEHQRIAPGHHGSYLGLLHLLQDLKMHKDASTAGLAEAALRSIVTDAKNAEDDTIAAACAETLSEALYDASYWGDYYSPPSENPPEKPALDDAVFAQDVIESYDWMQRLAVYLSGSMTGIENVLAVLGPVLGGVKGFAEQAFPFILHLVLLAQQDRNHAIKRKVSDSCKNWLAVTASSAVENQKLIINAILYLRTQAYPSETSIADRAHWLDIDLFSAARAAARCGMHKTSLLLVEVASTESTRPSRRSSAARDVDTGDLLLNIYENIDDPDAYYGLEQSANLSTVLARLEYEKDGAKSLAFRGAQYDSHIRRRDVASEDDSQALVKALRTLGLSGLSHSLLQNQQSLDAASTSLESTFQTARKLEIWNLPAPTSTVNHAATVYKAFQGVQQAAELSAIRKTIFDCFGDTMRALVNQRHNAANLRLHLGSLAVLTELDDVVNVSDFSDLEKRLANFEARNGWMRSGRYVLPRWVFFLLSCSC
jgi:serine-protein kinase ATM